MQCEHVRVTLDDDHLAGLCGMRPGEIQSKERAALVVDRALRRVHVLRRAALLKRSSSKAQHSATRIAQRKHDSTAKTIVETSPSALLDEPGRAELVLAEAGAQPPDENPIPGTRRVAHAELAEDFPLEPSLLQISAGSLR